MRSLRFWGLAYYGLTGRGGCRGGNGFSLVRGSMMNELAAAVKYDSWMKANTNPPVEGVWTVSVSILLVLVLPGSPDTPRPLLLKGLIRFSKEEQYILQTRLERDDKEKKGGAQGLAIPLETVWKTLLNYRRWAHYLSTCSVFATWSPLTTYTPTIIMSVMPLCIHSTWIIQADCRENQESRLHARSSKRPRGHRRRTYFARRLLLCMGQR